MVAKSKYPEFNKNLAYGKSWQDYRKDNSLAGKICSCGAKVNLQRHHVLKASSVQSHAPAFIEILCKDCHNKKHKHLRKK